MPSDLNHNGVIFGGWVMSEVDKAGSIAAFRRAQGPIATRRVDSFDFTKPIRIGDVVSFFADVESVGTTSVTVRVCVYAERGAGLAYEVVKVTEATLVYVAIDEHGAKRPLPAE
jgi:acyl-CoA thioesterase YciA